MYLEELKAIAESLDTISFSLGCICINIGVIALILGISIPTNKGDRYEHYTRNNAKEIKRKVSNDRV